jgi:hypothetical protein
MKHYQEIERRLGQKKATIITFEELDSAIKDDLDSYEKRWSDYYKLKRDLVSGLEDMDIE